MRLGSGSDCCTDNTEQELKENEGDPKMKGIALIFILNTTSEQG